jgi:hypothetical protein
MIVAIPIFVQVLLQPNRLAGPVAAAGSMSRRSLVLGPFAYPPLIRGSILNVKNVQKTRRNVDELRLRNPHSRPNTLAQTICHSSFFACISLADHTYRHRDDGKENWTQSRVFYVFVATPKQWEKPSSSVRKNSVCP